MKSIVMRATRDRCNGFSLVELMVALSILAILVGIAAPNFRDAILNARMSGLANDLMSDLANARSEAAKRGARLVLCTSNTGTACTSTGWDQGWIIFVDSVTQNGSVDSGERVLKVVRASGSGTTITATGVTAGTGGATYLRYQPSGTNAVAAGNIVFTLCDERTTTRVGAAAQNKGRRITIGTTGRASADRWTCA